jgi:DNA-binding transcriptional LysR family regulator
MNKFSHTLPLNQLRGFHLAAKHLSFAQAANELCITPAAISQHVKRLEILLGEKLFVRLQRQVKLTEAGRALANSLAPIFSDLERVFLDCMRGDAA